MSTEALLENITSNREKSLAFNKAKRDNLEQKLIVMAIGTSTEIGQRVFETNPIGLIERCGFAFSLTSECEKYI